MKPDHSIDYYAVLGVQPSASEEDIKKAFRKQDRNPGKEEEAKVRFQDAQVAHDILSDKTRREKYDRDRLKQNGLWEKQTPAKPSPDPSRRASSAFQQTQSARPARSATASRYAAFAKSPRESYYGQDKDTKFNAFKAWEQMKSGHRMQQEQQDQQQQQQQQQQRPPPPRQTRPAPTAQKQTRTRSDWDETPASRGSPGVTRSQSTRMPRRGGFNPYSNTGDEPISRNRSSYYSSTRTERAQTAESQYFPPPPSPGRAPRNESVGGDPSARPNLADMRAESHSSERLSTPYANTPKERTYFATRPSNGNRDGSGNDGFGRSARSSSNLESLGSQGSGRTMRPDQQHRSASPNTRTPQPPGAADDASPSDSEWEAYIDRMNRSQQASQGRRASADPRYSGPKVTVEDDLDDLPARFQNTNRNQTWASSPLEEQQPSARFHGPPHRDSQPNPIPSSSSSSSAAAPHPPHPSQRGPPPFGIYAPRPMHGSGGGNGAGNGGPMPHAHGDPTTAGPKRPSMYAYSTSSPHLASSREASRRAVHSEGDGTKQPAWPYWAIPSSLAPRNAGSHSKSLSDNSSASYRFPQSTPNLYADPTSPLHRFSIPSSSSSSAVPSKTSSVENVNVQFSPTDWHGKFTSATDYIGSQPGYSGFGARNSPPKHAGAGAGAGTGQGSPPRDANYRRESANPAQQMPPPPPPSQTNAAHDPHAQQGSPPKFSSEQWNKSFKEGSWVLPGPPLPPRPVQTPRSRNPRTTPVRRTPVNGRSAGPPVSEDTGNEGDDEARQSASNNETDGDDMSRSASATAMDIDTDTPPAAGATAGAPPPAASSRNTSAPPAPGQGSSATGVGQGPANPAETITTPSPAHGTAFPKPTEPQTGFNMHQMRNVFPLGSGTSASGLAGMKSDLGTTLPFESGASSTPPGPAPKPQRLELPHPPKPPLKPSYYTQVACEFYMKKLSAYMREFQAFNARMLDHFNARQAGMVTMTQNSTAAAEKGFLPMCNGMGGGGIPMNSNNGGGATNGQTGAAGTPMMADMAAWSWMGARGDDGFLRYTAWLREDDQVQEHWNEAWDVHRKAIKELGEVRKVMKALANSK